MKIWKTENFKRNLKEEDDIDEQELQDEFRRLCKQKYPSPIEDYKIKRTNGLVT